MKVKIRDEVKGLSVYPAGKPIDEVKREYGLNEIIKLASNENPLGCSSKAVQAIMELSDKVNLYPDPSVFLLKQRIAQKWGVSSDEIICGTGSDLLIRVLCSAVINPGDESIVGAVTFSRYADSTQLMGGKVIHVAMKDNALDIEAMTGSITKSTKIIWLCNPNNPTGTIFTGKQLERVISKIPEDILIVMDEAYYEYVTDEEYPESLSLISKYPNLVVLRTFSKAYGLAGLRVGYGICNKELAKHFNAIIGPFDVNIIAQAAASAAIEDAGFIQKSFEMNSESKEYFYKELDSIGLSYIKTQANFMMIKVIPDDYSVFLELLKKGIIVKAGSTLKMPGYLRVSTGTMEQNKKFIEALKEVLNK